MDKKTTTTRRPPRRFGPGGGPPGAPGEKAKDFKSAVKRLVKELGGWKILMLLGVIFSVISSVIFIAAPDKLADLTNEIKNVNKHTINNKGTPIQIEFKNKHEE